MLGESSPCVRPVSRLLLELNVSFGCDITKIQRWENGMQPRDYALPVLEAFFAQYGYTLADLGLEPERRAVCTPIAGAPTVAGGDAPSGVPGQEGDEVDRRRFIAALPAALALPTVPFPLDGKQVSDTGMAGVVYVRDAYRHLQVIDDQVGGDYLHPIAGQYLAHALALLDASKPGPSRTALHAVTGELAAYAAWFAYDAADLQQARTYLNEALLHARMARDPILESRVHHTTATIALKAGRARDALDAAQLAQEVISDSGTPRVKALLAMREARAWGQLGGAREAEAAAGRAWAHMQAAAAHHQDPDWLSFLTEAELLALHATCEADLGHHERAARKFEQSIAASGPFLRDRAIRHAHLAHVRLAQGDVEGGCAAATEATQSPVASGRTRARVTQFARRLPRYDTQVARDFLDRWHGQPPASR